MAGELLLPVKVVTAIITFLTYLLTFVLGGVVTILLLIYEVVAEAKIDKEERGPKQSKRLLNTPGPHNSSSSWTTIPTSNEPQVYH
jgi:hypothetical protein